MSELKIDLDYERLAAACRGSREQPKPWWRPERLLITLQVLAILIGAGWTGFLFMAFQRDQSRLAVASGTLDLTKKTSRQLEYSSELSVYSTGMKTVSGEDIYKVLFRYKAVNKSDAPLKLTFVTFELFQTAQPPTNESTVIELNPGNDLKGKIKWQTLATRVYCRHDDIATHPRINTTAGKTKEEDIIQDAGGTAQLNPGESSDNEWIFLVTARRTDWVNTVLHVAANDGKNPDDVSRFTQIKSLLEAKPLSGVIAPAAGETTK